MTDLMDDVDYDSKDFGVDDADERLPPWLTDTHFIYHLDRDEEGEKPGCFREGQSDLLCSPRRLSQMCMMEMVIDPAKLYKMKGGDIPNDLFPELLTEALLNHELHSIDYLVSRWPFPNLDVMSLLPMEEPIGPKYMTQPLVGHETLSLLDCFMHSLLTLKECSPLRVVNFAGFKKDRKLCRELARLPLLWIPPELRTAPYIHETLCKTIDISFDKVEQYLNKISCIYANMDPHIQHGRNFGPLTIVYECRFDLDDVPIGLALQGITPFRFGCHRMWMVPIPEASLGICSLNKVLQPRDITHFEYCNPTICADPSLYRELLEGLALLPNLVALSLPDTIHADLDPTVVEDLNQTVRSLSFLQKLSLQSCNLRDQLETVLIGIHQNIYYLNISDCRLSANDIEFLLEWKGLRDLKEFNLGSNNFKTIAGLCLQLLSGLSHVVCLGLSYSCFTDTGLRQVVSKCSDTPCLKVLGIQTFVPLSPVDMEFVLTACTAISSLQRCRLLPEAYAFLGNNESERNSNRDHTLELARATLDKLGRSDIVLE